MLIEDWRLVWVVLGTGLVRRYELFELPGDFFFAPSRYWKLFLAGRPMGNPEGLPGTLEANAWMLMLSDFLWRAWARSLELFLAAEVGGVRFEFAEVCKK